MTNVNKAPKDQGVDGAISQNLIQSGGAIRFTTPTPKVSALHKPNRNDGIYLLPDVLRDRNQAMVIIGPSLVDTEIYLWNSDYRNSSDQISSVNGVHEGHAFLTNLRIIFWSNDSQKPHKAVWLEHLSQLELIPRPFSKQTKIKIIADGKILEFLTDSQIANMISKAVIKVKNSN